MKKILVVSLFIMIVLILSNTYVFASDINLNLDPNSANGSVTTSANTNDNIPDLSVYGSPSENNATSNTSTNSSKSTKANQSTSSYDATLSVGSTAGISSSSLSLSNTLNIILIVLGILMVLFAIAILIRMRS